MGSVVEFVDHIVIFDFCCFVFISLQFSIPSTIFFCLNTVSSSLPCLELTL